MCLDIHIGYFNFSRCCEVRIYQSILKLLSWQSPLCAAGSALYFKIASAPCVVG